MPTHKAFVHSYMLWHVAYHASPFVMLKIFLLLMFLLQVSIWLSCFAELKDEIDETYEQRNRIKMTGSNNGEMILKAFFTLLIFSLMDQGKVFSGILINVF